MVSRSPWNWRVVVGSLAYPLLLLGGVTVTGLALESGVSPFLGITFVLTAAAFMVWGLEFLLPYRLDWRPRWRRFGLDLIHTLLSSGGTSKLVEITLIAWVVSASGELDGSAIWPGHLPLALQFVIAILVAEFGAYWIHRFCHGTSLGWRIHLVHHTAPSLHFLASGRTHPLNTVLVFGAQALFLSLAGAGGTVLAMVSVFTSINGFLQHANADLRPGALNLVVSTSDFHRWHHSAQLEESNTNFGNNLIVWDRVFGTVFLPSGQRDVEQVGLSDMDVPESYGAHLLAPFRDFEPSARGEHG
jgi:sterol desaturase/sphingolipid hydroxylase (fatty acid hydroxylase superfamily)